MLRTLSPLLIIFALFLNTGCVERLMQVRSEPTGAQVFLDGRHIGVTPIDVPFDFYGTREVMVRMEETTLRGDRSLAPQIRMVELDAPWYEWFPIDFISEHLWPGTIVDQHQVFFALEPQDLESLAEEFRSRARGFGITPPLEADVNR